MTAAEATRDWHEPLRHGLDRRLQQSPPTFRTLRPVQSTTRAALAAMLLILLLPAAAAAHASLVGSTPAADEVVTTLPPVISVTFDEALNDLSSLEIVDGTGATVATGAVDAADPMSLRAVTPDLANGEYEVRWTAATDDGHVERGTFSFSVAIPTAPPATPAPSVAVTVAPTTPTTPTTTTEPTAEPTAEPSATAAPAGTPGDGSAGGDVLIPIIAALALVAGGLVWFLRRRGAA